MQTRMQGKMLRVRALHDRVLWNDVDTTHMVLRHMALTDGPRVGSVCKLWSETWTCLSGLVKGDERRRTLIQRMDLMSTPLCALDSKERERIMQFRDWIMEYDKVMKPVRAFIEEWMLNTFYGISEEDRQAVIKYAFRICSPHVKYLKGLDEGYHAIVFAIRTWVLRTIRQGRIVLPRVKTWMVPVLNQLWLSGKR